MSDEPLTAVFRDEVTFAWEPVAPPGRLPRRFATSRWFGDADLATARVRPPLWRQAQPACWGFMARMRRRMVWVADATWH